MFPEDSEMYVIAVSILPELNTIHMQAVNAIGQHPKIRACGANQVSIAPFMTWILVRLIWAVSDWSFLRGVVPPSDFVNFFDIPWWRSHEADPDTLEKVFRNTPYSSIVNGVFCLRSETYADWKPGHWLCTPCFRVFMRDNVDVARLCCKSCQRHTWC